MLHGPGWTDRKSNIWRTTSDAPFYRSHVSKQSKRGFLRSLREPLLFWRKYFGID